MKRSELKGKVQTVLGVIKPDDMGVTLPHEHLLCDATPWFVEPEEASERRWVQHPVSLDILWWLRYHPFQNYDDLQVLDEKVITDELLTYKAYGGETVVDLTIRGLAPDPLGAARIARMTGLNVIMGTGYYVELSYPESMNVSAKSEEEIAEEFISDIFNGFGKTGIGAGIIGELGCTWPLTDCENKVLRAGARAQKATGASINIHPGQNENAAIEAVMILEKAGADISRVIMSHVDRAVREPKDRVELAKTGCVLEYDLFGREGYYPSKWRVIDIPNDAARLNEIMELCDKGFESQVLISQDCYNKTALCKYGGWGYAHILRDTLPVMRRKGISAELIHTLMVENPKRLYTFV